MDDTAIHSLKPRLKDICDSEEGALKCGGTYSSWQLRNALSLLDEINRHKSDADYEKYRTYTVRMIEIWRKAIARHNSQQLKCVKYDIETGLPTVGPVQEPLTLAPLQAEQEDGAGR